MDPVTVSALIAAGGEIIAELAKLVSSASVAKKQAAADALAALLAARDALRGARASTEAAEEQRDAETQRVIDVAGHVPGVALPTPAAEAHAVPVAAGGEAVETLK